VVRRKGDIDNLIKTVLDGLTKGGAWDDDRQVAAISAKFLTVAAGSEQTTIVVSENV